MSPHALMKNAQDATSNSGVCVPTNSKVGMAGGPGVFTSGEHAVTTAEGVSMDSEEGTIRNEPTMCEDELIKAEEEATATTETTKNEDSSAQIGIIKREGASAAAENEPLKNHKKFSNDHLSVRQKGVNVYTTMCVIAPIWIEIILSSDLLHPKDSDFSPSTHDHIAGPQVDELGKLQIATLPCIGCITPRCCVWKIIVRPGLSCFYVMSEVVHLVLNKYA